LPGRVPKAGMASSFGFHSQMGASPPTFARVIAASGE
jgi:hypothetical protein